jgi:alpha-D-ribose 1-methylphosphonate 5-triphosphate synthase subunit PhnI
MLFGFHVVVTEVMEQNCECVNIFKQSFGSLDTFSTDNGTKKQKS